MKWGREDGARGAGHGARGRCAGEESPKRDVNPLPTKPQGQRFAYGQAPRIGRGVPTATNGRGTGLRGACGGRATRGIIYTRHKVVSAEISASEEPRTARAGSTARRCRVKICRLNCKRTPLPLAQSVAVLIY